MLTNWYSVIKELRENIFLVHKFFDWLMEIVIISIYKEWGGVISCSPNYGGQIHEFQDFKDVSGSQGSWTLEIVKDFGAISKHKGQGGI